MDGAGKQDRSVVCIELLPDPDHVLIGSACGEVADGVHDVSERRVRDGPISRP